MREIEFTIYWCSAVFQYLPVKTVHDFVIQLLVPRLLPETEFETNSFYSVENSRTDFRFGVKVEKVVSTDRLYAIFLCANVVMINETRGSYAYY